MNNNCEICGEPMPEGEEMFNYHGFSGPCPKPPPPRDPAISDIRKDIERVIASLNYDGADIDSLTVGEIRRALPIEGRQS